MRTHELPARWGECGGAVIKARDDASWGTVITKTVTLVNQTMSQFAWGRDFMHSAADFDGQTHDCNHCRLTTH